jgi:hypothetical protein
MNGFARKGSLLMVALLAATPSFAKDEPPTSVRYARSWDEAVAEAKLLNVPIVVHSHGFF